MLLNVYTIFDSKAGVYSKPFYALNDRECERIANDILFYDNEISRHPEDFSLHKIAIFDDNNAEMKETLPNVCLLKFHELAALLAKKPIESALTPEPKKEGDK